MLKCKTADLKTCGQPAATASTRFEMFSLSGTFGTKYVFPEVLLSEIHLAPGKFEVKRISRVVSSSLSLKPSQTSCDNCYGNFYQLTFGNSLKLNVFRRWLFI